MVCKDLLERGKVALDEFQHKKSHKLSNYVQMNFKLSNILIHQSTIYNISCHSIRVGTNQTVRNTDSDTVKVQHCTAADVFVVCQSCLYTWTDRHPKHCNSVTVSTYYLISPTSNKAACVQ